MSRVDIVEYAGKEIVKADLSSLGEGEAVKIMQEAVDVVITLPKNSVLFLIDVQDVSYSRETVVGIKHFSMTTSPYIKATAVIGMDGLKQAILNTVRFLTLHEIKTFDSEQDAKDWLTQLQ
jgi:hypothetical protein